MRKFTVTVLCLLLIGCGDGLDELRGTGVCLGYPEESTSKYILPYEAGTSHAITQGNCTQYTHLGRSRYAYDMEMPINTNIIAARHGRVVEMKMDEDNGSAASENYMDVLHVDGSTGHYVHLQKNGNLVNVGDVVSQGQAIAKSGSSGTDDPHLHFIVFSKMYVESVPITFRNTIDHDEGLQKGVSYEAASFTANAE
jgi:murein DD-endopeptidase MepM/ murein hydrolase activator NlpD